MSGDVALTPLALLPFHPPPLGRARPLPLPPRIPRRGREPPPARYDSPPMLRRLFTGLTTLSLLLCVAATALWARSYHVTDEFSAHAHWGDGRHRLSVSVYSLRGILLLCAEHVVYSDPRDLEYRRPFPPLLTELRSYPVWKFPPDRRIYTGDPSQPKPWNRLGFSYVYGVVTPTHHRLTAPHVFAAGAFGVAPAVWLLRWRRRRQRRGRNLCATCGYDLRATPGRCPECGASPVEAA